MKLLVLMSTSALLLGTLGLGALFLPSEVLSLLSIEPVYNAKSLIQICGALCLSIAVMNWKARVPPSDSPCDSAVVVGNFWAFFVVSMLLIKNAIMFASATDVVVAGAASLLAAGFGGLVARSKCTVPTKNRGSDQTV